MSTCPDHIRQTATVLSVMALVLGCLSAQADWVRVSTSQQSVFYVDSQKSPRVGDTVMIWVLRDHKAMQPGQAILVRSSRIRRIFSSDPMWIAPR